MSERSAAGFGCWRCGADLAAVSLPLQRLAVCPNCEADLHVCRMCVHAIRSMRYRCDEERAEQPADTTRANFCDYLELSKAAFEPEDASAAEQARARLAALFGERPDVPEDGAEADTPEALKRLFGLDEDS